MIPDVSRQPALNVIRIGKNKDNDLVLEKPGISRYHAKLTLYTDFLGLLEDLNSSYGTEVDGRRIVQKIITPSSTVVLGTIVRLDVKALFDKAKPQSIQPPVVPELIQKRPVVTPVGNQPLVFAQEFKRLNWHFEQYTAAKQEILTGDPKKKAWIRVAISWVPGGFALASLVDAYVFNTAERVQVLDEAFRRDYKCPNPACQQFLGYVPFTDLLHQKQCRYCKCLWVDN